MIIPFVFGIFAAKRMIDIGITGNSFALTKALLTIYFILSKAVKPSAHITQNYSRPAVFSCYLSIIMLMNLSSAITILGATWWFRNLEFLRDIISMPLISSIIATIYCDLSV